jgi:hypothetical protein
LFENARDICKTVMIFRFVFVLKTSGAGLRSVDHADSQSTMDRRQDHSGSSPESSRFGAAAHHPRHDRAGIKRASRGICPGLTPARGAPDRVRGGSGGF